MEETNQDNTAFSKPQAINIIIAIYLFFFHPSKVSSLLAN